MRQDLIAAYTHQGMSPGVRLLVVLDERPLGSQDLPPPVFVSASAALQLDSR